MKILCYNVNGYRALSKKNNIINNQKINSNTFKNFITKENYDVICLQELKLNEDNIQLVFDDFPEYSHYCYNIPEQKKGYSGVAILSKKTPINQCVAHETEEGRFSQMEFSTFYLINVYIPNAGAKLEKLDKKHKFMKSFFTLCQKLDKKKPIIIVGDWNAIQEQRDAWNYKDVLNKLAGVTTQEINDLNHLLKLGFTNAFKKLHPNKIQYSYFTYRWKSREFNKGLLIDHVIVSDRFFKKIKNVKYLDNIYGSDHLAVQIDVSE